MTLQEFEKFRIDLEREEFQGAPADPLHFGIERCKHEKERLNKLVSLGDGVRSKTVKAKIERWRRQINRLDSFIDRMEKLKREIQSSRLIVRASTTNGP